MKSFDTFSIEQLVIYSLVTSSDIRLRVLPLTQKQYFQEQYLDIVFTKIKTLSDKKDNDITFQKIWFEIREQFKNEKETLKSIATLFESLDVDGDANEYGFTQEYILDKIEHWLKNRAVQCAVYDSILKLESGKNIDDLPSIFEHAVNITTRKSTALDYFDSAESRYDAMSQKEEQVGFCIEDLNKVTEGGFSRGTVNVIIGESGKGKSSIMYSLTSDYIRNGLNVLVVTLEMSKKKVAARIDANLLSTPINMLKDLTKRDYLQLFEKFKNDHDERGRLKIEQFPTGSINSNDIRKLLVELKQRDKFIPDVVVIDYVNLMNPSRQIKDMNMYQTIKTTCEELRGLATEYNFVCLTATQVNRAGMDGEEVTRTMISESTGLLFTVDFLIAFYYTDEQKEQEILIMKMLKTRDSDYTGHKFALRMQFPLMRLSALDEQDKHMIETRGFSSIKNQESFDDKLMKEGGQIAKPWRDKK